MSLELTLSPAQPILEAYPSQTQSNHALDHEHLVVYEFDVSPPRHNQEHLTVRWGARELLTYEIPIKIPNNHYGAVKYCVWGSGVFECENESWDIEPGMVFWYAPQLATRLTARRETHMSNFVLYLAGVEAMLEMERYLHVPVGASRLSQPKAVQNAIQGIMDEGRGIALHREENCALLARLLLRRIDAHSTESPASNALARQTFKRCRECIEKNFSRLTTLREVAETCDVTVPYLCRLFDQFFHCSPYDYMTRLKMSRAESLLLHPGAPVNEVATAVGYKDAKLFARNFKATFGKSPTKYRNRV